MAIEKMELVNIVGMLGDVNNVLLKCCESRCFHIEPAIHSSEKVSGFSLLNEENPYQNSLTKLKALAANLSIDLSTADTKDLDLKTVDEFNDYVNELSTCYAELNKTSQENLTQITQLEQTINQIEHLWGLDANFDRLFACKYVKVRLGRLPVESLAKLEYYDDKDFIFIPFDKNDTYVWGMYFVPDCDMPTADYIFNSLFFERIKVPDFVKGTPKKAYSELALQLTELKKAQTGIETELKNIVKDNDKKLCQVYTKLYRLSSTFDLRKKVAVINETFYIVGFIPKKEKKRFNALFKDMTSVSVTMCPPETDSALKPPTMLKNGVFSKPFGSLVEMYGLPGYHGINPTAFFAVVYSLLFGIMFGDLGQGAILLIAGLVMTHVMKKEAGGILTRIGAVSMIFGFVYGSLFGYEHALDPIYKAIGLRHKPVEVFEQTNLILIGAIVIGVTVIAISIGLNIVMGFKQKDYERAIFGNNGIVGLVLYLSIIIGVGLQMGLGIKVFNIFYILGLIVLPILILFFRVPLSNYVKYKKAYKEGDEPESVGTFIAENFFELFEFLLSYATNTLSFLRVGGFVLSHAGMMLVVMTLADMVSAGASIVIVIIGNAFVMALEGMVVAIQVMRLGYYEVFSRFYDGDGVPYKPVGIEEN